jgi:hypothetical protein
MYQLFIYFMTHGETHIKKDIRTYSTINRLKIESNKNIF